MTPGGVRGNQYHWFNEEDIGATSANDPLMFPPRSPGQTTRRDPLLPPIENYQSFVIIRPTPAPWAHSAPTEPTERVAPVIPLWRVVDAVGKGLMLTGSVSWATWAIGGPPLLLPSFAIFVFIAGVTSYCMAFPLRERN